MFVDEISENLKSTSNIAIRYDCDGGNERCGKLWTLKYRDAKKNFDKNAGKHICRNCWLKNNNPAKLKEVQAKIKKTKGTEKCPVELKKNTKQKSNNLK
jgi:hypothetical protein